MKVPGILLPRCRARRLSYAARRISFRGALSLAPVVLVFEATTPPTPQPLLRLSILDRAPNSPTGGVKRSISNPGPPETEGHALKKCRTGKGPRRAGCLREPLSKRWHLAHDGPSAFGGPGGVAAPSIWFPINNSLTSVACLYGTSRPTSPPVVYRLRRRLPQRRIEPRPELLLEKQGV